MITHEAVASIVQQHSGTHLFRDALRRADSPSAIVRVLALYAELNFDFGPCIATLASQVALQRSLFVDRSVEAFADRSYEVAAGVFNAAVDEFGGRSKKRPMTHRDMVQQMVLGASRHFSMEPSVLAKMIRREAPELAPLLRRIAEGYGFGKLLDAESTFRAIGFHLGQELCGDAEFHALDDSLRRDHGALFDFLKADHLSSWVTVHLTAESEHFDQAFVSVSRAFAYCADDRTEVLERQVLEGVEEFAVLQSDCMRLLASRPPSTRAPSAFASIS